MLTLLTPWRLKWYPRVILFALAAGFLIAIFTGSGASTLTGRLGGDFPAFYSAGRIIAEGNGRNLYSLKKQFSSERGLFPGEETSYIAFVNPPFWAALYSPLSLMNYRLSYVIHTLLLIGALLLSIYLLSPITEYIRKYYLIVFCFAITFFPMLTAVRGSQNTSLTLLLIVLTWRAVSANREWLAGVALGLLLFKPQFALPLIGLHILSGRWRVLLGCAPIAAILYGISTYISGPAWLNEWWAYANWAAQIDAANSYYISVCWLGFLQAILGPENLFTMIIGWGMTIITSTFLALLWFCGGKRSDYTSLMGITTAVLVLLPPHAMYYDTGILIFTFTILAAFLKGKSWKPLCLIWVLGFTEIADKFLGLSPMFFITLFTLLLSVRILFPSAIGIASSINLSEFNFRTLISRYTQEEKV